MGDVIHRGMLVTVNDTTPERAESYRRLAETAGLCTTPIIQSETNSYFSFAVLPSGSKLGWREDQRQKLALADFRGILKTAEDWRVEWVEVIYGHDVGASIVSAVRWYESDEAD